MVLSIDHVTEGTMAANDPKATDERRKCLHGMQKWYRRATRRERAKSEDEMEAVTRLHP
jgi:predicted secreted Zn-dependent protease